VSVFSSTRDAIKTAVESVADIGVVHNRPRYTVDQANYLTLFKTIITGSEQEIRAWWISWEGFEETDADGSRFGAPADLYVFLVHGIMGFADSSDTSTTFDNLTSAVIDAVRAKTDLGQAEVMDYSVTVTLPVLELRQFGSPLCHYCEIRVEATVVRAVTYG
jgi:hypothetical protein